MVTVAQPLQKNTRRILVVTLELGFGVARLDRAILLIAVVLAVVVVVANPPHLDALPVGASELVWPARHI